MTPIPILYLHNKSKISGGEKSLLNLWETLDRKKFRPFLLIPENGPFGKEASKLNIPVGILEIPAIKFKNIFSILRVIQKIKKTIKDNNIQLIHSYTPRNNFISSVVGKCCSISVVWHERNIPVSGEPDLTKKYFNFPDIVICNSHAVAQRFLTEENIIPAKVRVLINGVNIQKFNSAINCDDLKCKLHTDGKKVIGLVSNLSQRKRAEFFIEAAAKIRIDYPDCVFVLIGAEFGNEGEGRFDELMSLANHTQISPYLSMAGFQDDIERWISLFDIAVNVTEKDACSRSIIEAMACGKPVIAMNDGGSPELIEHNVSGLLVDSNNMAAFVRACVDLLKDNQRRLLMGENARKRAETKFDIHQNTRYVENIYTELINFKNNNLI